MLLFVGLGNPTPDSENNRHNVGFKIIDSINKKFHLRITTQKKQENEGESRIHGKSLKFR